MKSNQPPVESERAETCALTASKPLQQPLPKTTDSGAPVGEGSYEGAQGYAKRIDNYLSHADVEADAEAAAPRTPEEARELLRAEAEAARRSRAQGDRT